MAIFINATEAISPQATFKAHRVPDEVREYATMMTSLLPDFKAYFPPIELRRMSRIIKSGTSTAIECLREAGVEVPDAILTGTGLGCLEDTEKFLNKMVSNNEGFLTPTTFIQSTHNTIGAHVGLTKKCNEYNIAYVHKTISFELALMDAMMLIHEGYGHQVLVGGIDEITQENYDLKKRINLWKKEPFTNRELYKSGTHGYIPGEGAAFFLVSDQPAENSYAKIDMLELVFRVKSQEELEERLSLALKRNGCSLDEIDLVLFGYSGHPPSDRLYDTLRTRFFAQQDHAYFKHYCGEYDTASAFGLWMAANMIKTGYVPEIVRIGKAKRPTLRRILLYNQDENKNHAFTLLSSC